VRTCISSYAAKFRQEIHMCTVTLLCLGLQPIRSSGSHTDGRRTYARLLTSWNVCSGTEHLMPHSHLCAKLSLALLGLTHNFFRCITHVSSFWQYCTSWIFILFIFSSQMVLLQEQGLVHCITVIKYLRKNTVSSWRLTFVNFQKLLSVETIEPMHRSRSNQ
jgi:hypothetical protein